ncbi:histidine kinase [Beutenbergia cavernae DSM 12333]|uniref:Oxygen sensor histidine kinase NreB n=1 Tax=Beutenbergia cavernae (strain ATCC BAA-8 / DSM 12333 / CCUG 43141 / JCM 11478 / NBRC 16432 / NCIMB 13614 / HKI 0122) TaxID=471853 RepID=C5C2U0_BEUC1|nr:sensor histidine kinase [Beutenbergia cavernae]ACQ81784.1 histidine kinase [Beutenbergia cavernae DSM 12333]
MSVDVEPDAQTERRAQAIVTALPYVLLAVSTVVTLVQDDLTVPVAPVLALTAATVAWVAGFQVRIRASGGGSPAPLAAVYYAGLMIAAGGLVWLAPWYGIFAFVGYVHAYEHLVGGWRHVGAAVTSAIMAVVYLGGFAEIDGDWWLWGAIVVVSSVLASLCFEFLDVSDRHAAEQRQALAEVHEANARLEAALEENAGLHAQLLVQAREAGVLDERQRMAREIHDTLAQGLAGILTQLQAAEQAAHEPEAWGRHVTNATDLARESLAEARRTVHAVEPEALADARLPEAIGDVARRWSEVNDVRADLTTTGDPRPMHVDVEVTLLRAAQEALANVAKHARASRVGLTLSYMEDLVTLDVRDDGVGFEPDATRGQGHADGGFGLAGMRQRVQRLAGRLDVESEPGGGTAISASVPAIPATPAVPAGPAGGPQ